MVRTRDYADLGKKLKEKFEKKNNFVRDPRFWVVSRDEAGNGSAIIRFLPNKNLKDYPFVESYKHSFKLNNKNFIDRCLKTIDKDCPICEWCSSQDKEFVKKHQIYRKTNYIHNILVENDPANPENNGKVFIFEFGPQLFEVLKEEFMDEKEEEWYFTIEHNKPFKIKVKPGAGGYGNWTASKFLNQTPIDFDELNITESELMEKLYDLGEFIRQSEYKTYDELKSKFDKFMITNGIEKEIEKYENDVKEEKLANDYTDKKREIALGEEDDSNEIPVTKIEKIEKAEKVEEPKKKVDKKLKKLEEVDDYFKKFEVD